MKTTSSYVTAQTLRLGAVFGRGDITCVMSYLIRVHLPDVPGSLGELAEAFGMIDADIRSVDIVQMDRAGVVTDDIVVELPTGTLVDALITAARSIEGAEVDSIRPFTGTVDRRGQIQMLARIADTTGDVTAVIDASSLPNNAAPDPNNVLNGIAHIPGTEEFYLSGKRWPDLYRVSFQPAAVG